MPGNWRGFPHKDYCTQSASRNGSSQTAEPWLASGPPVGVTPCPTIPLCFLANHSVASLCSIQFPQPTKSPPNTSEDPKWSEENDPFLSHCRPPSGSYSYSQDVSFPRTTDIGNDYFITMRPWFLLWWLAWEYTLASIEQRCPNTAVQQ